MVKHIESSIDDIKIGKKTERHPKSPGTLQNQGQLPILFSFLNI